LPLQAEDTYGAFKAPVARCGPTVDVETGANGDTWLAAEGLSLGLVDEISTGDDWLFRARDSARLYEVTTEARKTLLQQLLGGLGVAARRAADFAAAQLR
jgi:serine protease SohB